ncbi:N-acetylmuramoyl-L-alanine amidase [Adlercreutzia sp. R25]|uniref:N-acetylmuramoyl-L-alanine amidase n=1 Tax=Adlercreutzia shanghongiae TaxID=3111773 RepID=A0ABU6IX34_9ACTN|nr:MULTISPECIES: N-acetylmuramoyl-L-alanine amidase [unclassified Adlercreutzia]MEC4272476.1 N-acetylmuramoyl-L-alanine amidase [Adlercreutzia sp. R25]MEC4294338.1 N-acetylmuramoyl-L-alanine amidase [Adlercreutzia sp. R22]
MAEQLLINTYHGSFNKSRRTGGLGAVQNFATHYTGGIGSARNNCIYFATANRNASADFFIDKDGTIWEYNNILDGYYTWHVGDGKGKYGITNTNSIGVEVVSNGEDFTAAQRASLSKLYAHCCSILGRKLNVVRHYDASRKYCPSPYVDSSKWGSLKTEILGGQPTQAVNKPAAATPAAKPSAPATKPADKKYTGAKGNIADFQRWLRVTYKYDCDDDNLFGPKTRKFAVMALQSELNSQFGKGLKVDGSFGGNTYVACISVRNGARGNITRILQGMLYCRGYNPKGFDGVFGSDTGKAVGAFQSSKGLTPDKIAGRNTWRKLCV